jgi:hypothetical protein
MREVAATLKAIHTLLAVFMRREARGFATA